MNFSDSINEEEKQLDRRGRFPTSSFELNCGNRIAQELHSADLPRAHVVLCCGLRHKKKDKNSYLKNEEK